jgi:hypothetical protein
MKEIKFNINDTVKVKLTPYGVQTLKNNIAEVNKKLPPNAKPLRYIPMKKDKNGYTEFQLWSLMNNFGHVISLTSEAPFETNILIPIKD